MKNRQVVMGAVGYKSGGRVHEQHRAKQEAGPKEHRANMAVPKKKAMPGNRWGGEIRSRVFARCLSWGSWPGKGGSVRSGFAKLAKAAGRVGAQVEGQRKMEAKKNAPFCIGGWGRLHVKRRKGLELAGSNMPEGRRGSGIECKKQGWEKNEAK